MRPIGIISVLALSLGAASCASNEPNYPDSSYCIDDTGNVVTRTASTVVEGVEGGAETGVAGVKQAGRATGGLITGGTEGAEEAWEEGGVETREEAREASREIDQAQLPEC